ncbi:MAG: PD-(D/E)XK nuclease family protein, partial [Prevotellaceae bacterium]|nr:PD-(D/E)XK nuclease family protein [Prevotellaceae bacterium]
KQQIINGQPLPINITIGYNLSYTTIPSQLDSMMKEKGYTNAETLLEKVHFLVDRITDLGKKENIDPLEKESLFRTYTLLNRLSKLIKEGFLDITEITFRRLFTQLLQSTSVPFHGEPIEGIQIMGVLETRNLDFRNILFLSCNEGVMPKCGVQTSFMPYFIRKAYNLSTIDNKVDIFAYYFYRLLQRCDNATIIWNSSTEGSQRGEMSRFMLQMLVESKHDIKKYALQGNVNSCIPMQTGVASIRKTEAIMQKLLRKFSDDGEKKIISPTAFGRYLRCPKLFYFESVAELHEYEDPEEKENDNRTFGNVFHTTVHDIYKPFIGRQLTGTAVDELNDQAVINKLVCKNYAKEMNWDNSVKISGLAKIRTDVITTYIRKLLDSDKRLTPFTIVDLEKYITKTCKINIGENNEFEISIGGYSFVCCFFLNTV